MREHNQVLNERSYSIVPSRENMKFIVYEGSSMSSVFQDMDVLYYIPNKKIRVGDVVVIKISDYGHKIIHRVISVGKKGIKTMGDCNPHSDNWILSPSNIIGSVAYGYRGRRRFGVLGGPAGLAQMFNFRLKYFIIKTVHPILSTIYYNLPVSKLTIFLIQPRIVAFKRLDGTELHLLARGKIIGRHPPGQKWQIRSPFRFFLDEGSLPD